MICPLVALALARMVEASRGLMVNGSITRIFLPKRCTLNNCYYGNVLLAVVANSSSGFHIRKHRTTKMWMVLMKYLNVSTRGHCKVTFTGKYISSRQGLMKRNTSSNHSHIITVRLTHHLAKYIYIYIFCCQELVCESVCIIRILIITLATPTSNFSSGE